MNNDSVGAIQAKTGVNACVLNRASGFRKTVDAMASKTRSPHAAKGGPQEYHAVRAGFGDNENVVGYSGGNKTS